MSIKSWFKHAFAVESSDPVVPTEEQQVPVDWVSKQIVKRHLTTPALFTLEMSRPLNFVTAQMMHVMGPAVWAMTPPEMYANYNALAAFLEKRGSVDHICRRIEQLEAEAVERERGKRVNAETPKSEETERRRDGETKLP
jgi:hypothetical protein